VCHALILEGLPVCCILDHAFLRDRYVSGDPPAVFRDLRRVAGEASSGCRLFTGNREKTTCGLVLQDVLACVYARFSHLLAEHRRAGGMLRAHPAPSLEQSTTMKGPDLAIEAIEECSLLLVSRGVPRRPANFLPCCLPACPPSHCRWALKRDQGRGRRDANGGSSTTKTGLRQGWLPVSVRRRLRVSCWRDSPCVAAAITPYHSQCPHGVAKCREGATPKWTSKSAGSVA